MDSSNKLPDDFDLMGLKFAELSEGGGFMNALEDINEPSGYIGMDTNTSGGPPGGSNMANMNSMYSNAKPPCKLTST